LTTPAHDRRRRHTWPLTLLVALAAAVALPVFLALGPYSNGAVWPGLVGSFTASLLAFLVALAWDRQQRAEDDTRAQIQRDADLRDAEEDALLLRRTEARRRYGAILLELRKNKTSIQDAEQAFARQEVLPGDLRSVEIILPQLLRGAWLSSAEPLSRIGADVELVADLGTFYGRIEELQWRLRARVRVIDNNQLREALDRMTTPLVDELREEVAGLLTRVEEEAQNPAVPKEGILVRRRLADDGIAPGTQ
jgi:hypothetical protein